jgi:hypothetical protein
MPTYTTFAYKSPMLNASHGPEHLLGVFIRHIYDTAFNSEISILDKWHFTNQIRIWICNSSDSEQWKPLLVLSSVIIMLHCCLYPNTDHSLKTVSPLILTGASANTRKAVYFLLVTMQSHDLLFPPKHWWCGFVMLRYTRAQEAMWEQIQIEGNIPILKH